FGNTLVKPTLMVILDGSGSMGSSLEGSTRWNVALGAINTLLTTYEDTVRFGLATYPKKCPSGSGDNCNRMGNSVQNCYAGDWSLPEETLVDPDESLWDYDGNNCDGYSTSGTNSTAQLNKIRHCFAGTPDIPAGENTNASIA